MKRLKRVIWVLTISVAVSVLVSKTWAASWMSSVLIREKDNSETSLERGIDSGITLTCEGVFFKDNAVWVGYTVLCEEDVVIEIGALTDLFDDRGRTIKTPVISEHRCILIGGNRGNRREIIGGVKTAVAIGYYLRKKYEPPEKFARLSININGKNEIFRSVPIIASSEFNVDAYGEKVTFPLAGGSFFEFNEHTYKIFPEAVDWHTARQRCEEEGGHLCTITSQEEYDSIISNLPQLDRRYIYWLGATDEKQEGLWNWVTGEKFNFAMWNRGEPNNESGREHYLDLRYSNNNWVWNDWKVGESAYYICEWE